MPLRARYGAIVCSLLMSCAALADEPDDADSPLADDTARRCVRDDPTSRDEIERLAAEARVVEDCASDDGPCQASSECVRDADARECDTARLISPTAASCIARVSGLASGLNGFALNLTYNFGERRIIWNVMNTLSDRGMDGKSGASMTIDAVTGEVLAQHGWSAIP